MTGRRDVMGTHANGPVLRLVGWSVGALVVALNLGLVIVWVVGIA